MGPLQRKTGCLVKLFKISGLEDFGIYNIISLAGVNWTLNLKP